MFRDALDVMSTTGQTYARGRIESTLEFAAGEIRLPRPEPVIHALREAASRASSTGYTNPNGDADLQRSILEGLNIPDSHTSLVTAGGKEAVWLAIEAALADSGDHPTVMVPRPGWLPYQLMAEVRHAKVVTYHPADPDAVAGQLEVQRPHVLVLNYPNNPTGADLTQDQVDGIVRVARSLGTRIVSDEVYQSFSSSGATLAAVADGGIAQDIIIGSASKSLAAAGLRVGFLIASRNAIETISAVRSIYASGTSDVAQACALTLLTDATCQGWLTEVHELVALNRDALAGELSRLRVPVVSGGGMYLWVRRSRSTVVPGPAAAVVAGGGFGDDSCVRVCVARSIEDLEGAALAVARAADDNYG